ncbi:MAG: hypothetical protein S4CHLAM6_14270 [Chlamydiae bacterium]|nr:hypothetical protein [Chlamydiota bacterium]
MSISYLTRAGSFDGSDVGRDKLALSVQSQVETSRNEDRNFQETLANALHPFDNAVEVSPRFDQVPAATIWDGKFSVETSLKGNVVSFATSSILEQSKFMSYPLSPHSKRLQPDRFKLVEPNYNSINVEEDGSYKYEFTLEGYSKDSRVGITPLQVYIRPRSPCPRSPEVNLATTDTDQCAAEAASKKPEDRFALQDALVLFLQKKRQAGELSEEVLECLFEADLKTFFTTMQVVSTGAGAAAWVMGGWNIATVILKIIGYTASTIDTAGKAMQAARSKSFPDELEALRKKLLGLDPAPPKEDLATPTPLNQDWVDVNPEDFKQAGELTAPTIDFELKNKAVPKIVIEEDVSEGD